MSKYQISIDGNEFVVEVGDVSTSPVRVVVNGQAKMVEFREADILAAPPATADTAKSRPEAKPALGTVAVAPVTGGGQIVRAPMPGKVLSIVVAVGDPISKGDTVCTLEAMKMEMPISSTASGTLQGVHVDVGDTVAYDDPLVTVG